MSVTVDADGRLDVCVAQDFGRYRHLRCSPVGTAMWIALRQHGGDVDAAADMLAALWGTEPENARADLGIWVDEMRDAGLVRDEA
ncbi:PqqD family peptide modification chaperone [Streptomyces agglomeratus]|uniref:PqqD family peptide modification chaperone n=1 Tax=Streptomyces agglomeratus TaxID=285458 RepID=UPI001FD5B170|nr:PqqD family peptide modification chaperone [Streptomyces agglomeratus]